MSGKPVRITGLVKNYGALNVLRGIDIDIASGSTVAVIGPSGSGKSTLVRCINHLEPIQGGTIEVGDSRISARGVEENGRILGSAGVARFRSHIGMVFQQFNLYPHFTVMQNIIEAPVGVLKVDRAEAIDKGKELLAKVNLLEKAGVYPAHLSGGQQQRVAIVRALMMDPNVMLFDEPTSALDPELIGEVLKVIADLAIRGRTSIIVTHELNFAREIADRVIFMDGGLIIEDGKPEDVLDRPAKDRTRAFIGKIGRRQE
ncbi:MAG TPA: amino acid ABC transporter ATP-binding protein [Pseudorhodoplanes sp.]|nr:amino acid ABC transporter ATP-binding protein [Pseudorhodoplanes sp.]